MNIILSTIKHSFRSLSKAPGYSAIVIFCLALGIGASAGIYSVANTVLIQGLPFDEREQLITISGTSYQPGQEGTRWAVSVESYALLRDSLRTLDSFGGIQGGQSFLLTGGDEAKQITGARVTASVFSSLRHQFLLGRAISEAEEKQNAPVAVISSGLWQREFNADPNIIGRQVIIEGISHSIIGVIPSVQEFPLQSEMYLPYAVDQNIATNEHAGVFFVVGRVSRIQDLQVIQEELNRAEEILHQRYPIGRVQGTGFKVEYLQDVLVGGIRAGILAVSAAVAFLLAITCINIANLLLVRIQDRQRQLAIMSALGAGRTQIFRQMLTEITLLALPGGLLGIAGVYFLVPLLVKLNPALLPNATQVSIDQSVLAFAIALTLIISLAICIVAVVRFNRLDVFNIIREGGNKGGGGSRRFNKVLSGLIVTEIAATALLIVGAALMVRTFQEIQAIDTGFDTQGVLTMRIGVPPSEAQTHEDRVRFVDEVLAEIRSLPGVGAAGAASNLPVGGGGRGFRFSVEGQPTADPNSFHLAVYRLVHSGYLQAMNIELLEGRYIDDSDRIDGRLTVIISKEMARQFWPNESPLGKRIKRGAYNEDSPWRTIVGVVEDVPDQFGPNGPSIRNGVGLSFYMPNAQYIRANTFQMDIAIRTEADPNGLIAPIRERILGLHRDTLITNVQPMAVVLNNSLTQEKFVLIMFITFALIGLALSAAGIYGVVAYTVNQKVKEFGIRMAIGATAGDVLKQVLVKSILLAVIGLTIGLGLALASGNMLETILYNVSVADPLVYIGVTLFLVITTVVAAVMPAWRAARTNPALVLQE